MHGGAVRTLKILELNDKSELDKTKTRNKNSAPPPLPIPTEKEMSETKKIPVKPKYFPK